MSILTGEAKFLSFSWPTQVKDKYPIMPKNLFKYSKRNKTSTKSAQLIGAQYHSRSLVWETLNTSFIIRQERILMHFWKPEELVEYTDWDWETIMLVSKTIMSSGNKTYGMIWRFIARIIL
jgi:hypothetical protein